MGAAIRLQKGLVALALPAAVLGTIGLAPGAEADIALSIVDLDGTQLGSITLPATTGSSPTGVTFELDAGTLFTESHITSLTWDLDPQTPGGESLELSALAGDLPCNSPADGPCTKFELTLNLDSFFLGRLSCPAPPPPGQGAICSGIGTITFVELVDAAPAYACVGFEPPLADGPVTVRGNRALPLKAELRDEDGIALTDADLGAAPVVQVEYHSGVDASPEDVSDQALWAGQGSSGNAFVFNGDRWRFNLKVGNYSAPGTYAISMISGDGGEYRVDPTCESEFIVSP
jgi:hypothetical protein